MQEMTWYTMFWFMVILWTFIVGVMVGLGLGKRFWEDEE
jgi:hypothetical protein